MRIMKIPATTRVQELGRRIALEGGPRAVLLYHGWTGWPGRLSHLAGRLNEAGYTVVVPRLPGHGTNMADMLQTRAEDWVRSAVDEYLDLADRFDQIYLAGTSMGGVIATLVAVRFNVARLALLAPAFATRNRFVGLSPFLKRLVPSIRTSWQEDKETDPRVVALGREYSTHNYTSMIAELVRIQRTGRRSLRDLKADTLVVVSLADQSVPPGVADLVEERARHARVERVTVERSNHQLSEHVDRDVVADAVVSWFVNCHEP